MCRNIYAPGSHDLVVGTTECSDPRCPMKFENAVPMNKAARDARRSQGLADHPDGWKKGDSMEDVLSRVSSLFGAKP